MLFNQEDKKKLLSRLPSFELSYEPKLHKKVYSSVFYVIPKGPKALVWYTYWKDQNVCLLIRINERGNYSDVQLFPSSFSDKLALGTIIYGTYFLHYNKHYFSCEQLHYYKGLHVSKRTYNERLKLLLEMFQNEMEQIAYTANSLIVGLPMMTNTYEAALDLLFTLPYKTYGVGSPRDTGPIYAGPIYTDPIYAGPVTPAFVATPIPLNKYINKAIFKVKADLAADNYLLYTSDNSLYDTAIIPSYTSSVMMNSLFRNIKENTNLDLLEESDDDDEFENTSIDKFVDLEKTRVMECVYSKRFKKWQPVKTLSDTIKLVSFTELPIIKIKI